MTLITQHFDSLSTDLMRLNFMAHEVSDNLNEQTKLLRVRSLGLPEPVLAEANRVSGALDELSQQLEDDHIELAHLRALVQTAALINSTLDVNEVLSRAMDTVIGLTDVERGYILLHNEETGKMEFMIGRKIGREAIEDGEFIISRSIVDEVLRTGKAIVTTNAQEDARFNSSESVMSYALRSILCVPLIYRDQIYGAVYADNRIRQALFGERELNLLANFANQAVVAIENARLFEKVRARLAEVREKQQLLESIFASIASGVITTDYKADILTCSPVACSILRISREETLGKSAFHILPGIYEGFDELFMTVQTQDRQEVVELNTVIAERGPANLVLKLSALKAETDQTMGVAMVVDDLTEIKQRDETLNVVRTYLPPEMVHNIQSIEGLGLSGEEREISVVFADVRGFTSFSERLEPEYLLEIINKYLASSSTAIQNFNGIIDKYMGDAVVGLYNTQLNPQDDHAVRAVETAVMIMQNVNALHAQMPADHCLFYGVGVHTDDAILGNVGSPSRKEFTALGEALTYSKKLMEVADEGEVLISESTYQRVKHVFRGEQVERVLRDGVTIVNPYRIVGYQD